MLEKIPLAGKNSTGYPPKIPLPPLCISTPPPHGNVCPLAKGLHIGSHVWLFVICLSYFIGYFKAFLDVKKLRQYKSPP